jgi:deoxyhypusine synthase
VDWIVSTGANLYHDLHFTLNYPVRMGSFTMDDTELRDNDIVRVYDVLLGYSDCLMATDEILRGILIGSEFQKEMDTAELHYLLGKHAAAWERQHGLKDVSVLVAAQRERATPAMGPATRRFQQCRARRAGRQPGRPRARLTWAAPRR